MEIDEEMGLGAVDSVVEIVGWVQTIVGGLEDKGGWLEIGAEKVGVSESIIDQGESLKGIG